MPTPAVSISSRHVSPAPSATRSLDSRASSPTRLQVHNILETDQKGVSSRVTSTARSGRNRNALRQFYGLGGTDAKGISELERADFDAGKWVENICAEKSLGELLKTENELVNEIRGLDGERKSLVYDNYSKLIVATDTIRKMRADLAPLAPTTSTLEPALNHIAEVSSSLVESLATISHSPKQASLKNKKQTVKWALNTPARLQRMVNERNLEGARADKAEIIGLLDKWEGVRGVKELREAIEAVIIAEEREEETSMTVTEDAHRQDDA